MRTTQAARYARWSAILARCWPPSWPARWMCVAPGRGCRARKTAALLGARCRAAAVRSASRFPTRLKPAITLSSLCAPRTLARNSVERRSQRARKVGRLGDGVRTKTACAPGIICTPAPANISSPPAAFCVKAGAVQIDLQSAEDAKRLFPGDCGAAPIRPRIVMHIHTSNVSFQSGQDRHYGHERSGR